MNYKKLKKPEHLKDETWSQHLNWMGVMTRQLDENLEMHRTRVKLDADRSKALLNAHLEALRDTRCPVSLFSFSNGVRPRDLK